jgi:hypothetical protein
MPGNTGEGEVEEQTRERGEKHIPGEADGRHGHGGHSGTHQAHSGARFGQATPRWPPRHPSTAPHPHMNTREGPRHLRRAAAAEAETLGTREGRGRAGEDKFARLKQTIGCAVERRGRYDRSGRRGWPETAGFNRRRRRRPRRRES